MSKSNGTTKIATFSCWMFEGEEYEGFIEEWTSELRPDNAGNCVGAQMANGLRVAGTNTFTGVMPGDRVVLRADAPRSYDTTRPRPRKWVMTGRA
jgi:hypothetical protein